MEDWVECSLGEVCFTTSGGTPSRSNKSFYEGKIPWIKSGELNDNIILDSVEHISEEALKKSSAKIFPKGTLLFALYGATIGKMATLGIEAATNQAICGIYKSNIFNSRFLYNYLLHKKRYLINQGIGGAQPNISQTILKKLIIPIAPLVEQRAIVSKIESLFSSLDSGIADLKKAQAQLKIYRQAVLKKAFEGELTKEWREMNNVSNKWESLELNVISTSRLGKMLDKTKNIGTFHPYLGNINVRWGKFNLEALKVMRIEDTEHTKYQVVKGDLVICEGGEPGRCAVWQREEPVFIQKALHKVRFTNNYDPVFFYYYFFHQAKTGGLKEYFTGTTIKHLTGRKLKDFLVPICSKEEQMQIIKEIESRLSVCDSVEESIKDSLAKAQALRQSILKKAFEGKLLTAAEIEKCKQAADYEPASVLLARVKKEKKK